MERLLLRFTPGTTASWCLSGSPRRIMHGSLEDAARAAVGQRVTVLVPCDDITLLTARLPTRQRRRLRQALPYALEDQLAADVETLHFATGTQRGEELPCAVIARDILRGWIETLEGAGIRPDTLLPDILALPYPPDEWSLLAEPTGVRLRSGAADGLACDAEALPHLLPLLLQSGDHRPTRLHCYHSAGSDALCEQLTQWCNAQGIALHATPLEDPLNILAPNAAREADIDLLQGEFSRREQNRQLWWPWRASAALLIVLLLLQGASFALRYNRLAQQDAQLSERIAEVYRSTFPESQRVVDARAQMEQKLTTLRRATAAQDFHQLLLHAAPVLSETGAELRALRYAAGALEMELKTSELQILDRLKQTLARDGMRAEITGADSSGGAVAGRIVLRKEGT